MNKTNTTRRYVRRFAGLIMIALASTLLNGCILTQLFGGLAGQGGLLGNPGQIPPAAGPLAGPVTGGLPGTPTNPGTTTPGTTTPGTTTPGTTTTAALVPLAANLQPAIIQQIQSMDVEIQNRQSRISALVRDRDEYVRRAGARQQTDPLLAQEQSLIAQRNQEINTDQAALNDLVGRRNRLASGQPA